MRIIKSLLLSLLITVPASADVRFNDLFDANLHQFNDTADRIASYYSEEQTLSKAQQKNELQALNTNLDAMISVQQENPIFWFLKGMNENNTADLLHQMDDQDGMQLHIEARNRAYEKAMNLDEKTQTLTASMYATMKHGLPDELRIRAIQSELALGGNGENESYYWYLHWSNINALQQAGRQQEAEQALETMKQELKEHEVSLDDYQLMVDRVQQELQQPVQKQPPPPPSVTAIESNTPPATDELEFLPSRSALIWIVVAVSLVIMIALAVYEIVFRSRK